MVGVAMWPGHLAGRLVRAALQKALWLFPRHFPSLWRRVPARWVYAWVCIKSLFYNTFGSYDVVLDTLLEPLFWLVEWLTRWFGLVFVVTVVILMAAVVAVAYICVLPRIIRTYDPYISVLLVLISHWLLLMITFHYYQALTTSPGHLPLGRMDLPAASICKKCIAWRPPRAHHCSICNRCILKMDHHCPWLNNCVGHYNHRYFFSFCFYMCVGCTFASLTINVTFFHTTDGNQHVNTNVSASALEMKPGKVDYYHNSVIFIWILCSTVASVLGLLTAWHAVLISHGETSVERHINRKERRRLCKEGQATCFSMVIPAQLMPAVCARFSGIPMIMVLRTTGKCFWE
uniref:palmitoyltransferase ZDHHC16-like isoform X2 n=1 Tax=Myxine glutinosa TaxID=7769 RepID=UPI00358FAE4C